MPRMTDFASKMPIKIGSHCSRRVKLVRASLNYVLSSDRHDVKIAKELQRESIRVQGQQLVSCIHEFTLRIHECIAPR